MNLYDVAHDLYGVAPGDFVAARNARAAQLKADGDRELAGNTAKLVKPSASAWAVNLLASEGGALEGEFTELGHQLRDAQADPDRETVSRLVSERRKLVARAVAAAATRARNTANVDLSRSALDQVEQTFLAALADKDALAATFSGRLSRSLEAIGFEPVDLSGAIAGGEAPRSRARSGKARERRAPTKTTETKRARQKQTADDAAGEAKAAAERAAEAVDEISTRREEHHAAKAELANELEELRERFEQLEAKQAELGEKESRLDRELSRAEEARRRADTDARTKRIRADRLD